MTFLDTSALVGSLAGAKRSGPALRKAIDSGERMLISSLVLYEWLRGPRLEEELALQERLFPRETVVIFDARAAALSAKLYQSLGRARGREVDIAIAAWALA